MEVLIWNIGRHEEKERLINSYFSSAEHNLCQAAEMS